MSESSEKVYPAPSVRRLPIYLSLLRKMRDQGVEGISSTRIAEQLGLTGIQVRKDLAMTGIVGRPKVGHSIHELIEHIERFLGWDVQQDAILIGVGHLGTALLGYKGFKQENLNIVATFDNSPDKIGKKILGRPVYAMKDFRKFMRGKGISLAILTVPVQFAQETAEIMVKAGIRGIWNFAPIQLQVSDEIIVENVSLSSSLALLTQKLSHQS
ncbi:MAG: redox-sensing transcriptional repressor Rex [Planctomycetia bacterium]|nr:redox-sensing transcriptional repressor Rex [Planctomycetia bacterium]